jgi:FtsP/CotA-like multicopper oxidase with cupredoxin domain
MKLTRRDFLGLTAAGLLVRPALAIGSSTDSPIRQKLIVLPERRNWGGSGVDLWGFDTDLLRLKQGVPVTIEVENRLPQPTSVHWHGLRIDNAMDGVSGLTQSPISSGGRFTYRFTPRDAGTFWAHSHHRTYEQLARGLYLPLIVEEPEPYDVDRDLTLALDDWRINEAGALDVDSFGDMHDWAHGGRIGNLPTVNRAIGPAFDVLAGERVRLRLLNTANARIMMLRLPGLKAWVVAKDGQPLARVSRMKEALILAPAERYDLVVDIPEQGKDQFVLQTVSGNSSVNLAHFVVQGRANSARRKMPDPLPSNPLQSFGTQQAAHRLVLNMTGGAMGSLKEAIYQGKTLGIRELVQKHQVWAFNGVANLPEKPILEVQRGEVVEIEILNNTRWPHSMHLHGHHFQSDLARYESGIWHDTLAMAAGERATIRFRAENPGDWLFHCHMIEHQAAGMVTRLRVLG